MILLQQSEATAAQRRIMLHLVDAVDGITPETGEAAGQPQLSKNGAAFANTTATLTSIGNGAYYVELTATELNTLGFGVVRYKSANTAEFQCLFQVVPFDPYSATNLGLRDITNLKFLVAGVSQERQAAEQGTTFYWDPTNGNDANDGLTPETAKAGFTSVYGLVTAGAHDTVVILADSGSSTIDITEQITLSKSQSILQGPGRSVRFIPSSTTGVTITVSAAGCVLRNLTVRTATSGGTADGISVTATDFVIEDCWVTDCQDEGIIVIGTGIVSGVIRRCRIKDVLGEGILINGSTAAISNILIDTVYIDGAGNNGIQLLGSTNPVSESLVRNVTAVGCVGRGVLEGAGCNHNVFSDIRGANNTLGNLSVNGATSRDFTALGPAVSGVADSGSTTTLVDSIRTEADANYWRGALIRFTSGNIAGQSAIVTAFDPATDTITFFPAVTQAVSTHNYDLISLASPVTVAPYRDGVWIDATSGVAGTTYPTGERATPVSNFTDAKTIADANKVRQFNFVRGNFTIGAGDYSGYSFEGQGPTNSIVTMTAASTLAGTTFRRLDLDGDLSSQAGMFAEECRLNAGITGVLGGFMRCVLGGTLTIGNGNVFFGYCSGSHSADNVTFDLALGASVRMSVLGWSGRSNIASEAAGADVDFGMAGGEVQVLSSCTGGIIVVWGSGIAKNAGGAGVVFNKTGLAPVVLINGTSTASGTTTTLVDSGRTEATTNHWKGCWILFTEGTNLNQVRLITAFDAGTDTLTFAPPVNVSTASGDSYDILPAGRADLELWRGTAPSNLVGTAVDANVSGLQPNTITATVVATDAIDADALAQSAADKVVESVSGTADSGTTTTLVDAARTEADTDYWKGAILLMTSGNLFGQRRRITSFNASTDTITVDAAFTQAVGTHTYIILRTAYGEAAGAGSGDWTSAEKEQIRDSLGVDGVKTAAVGGDVQDIQARLPATLNGARMRSHVEALDADVITATVIAPDAIGSSELAATAAGEIADAVWDEALAGHLGAGSTGAALDNASTGVTTLLSRITATLFSGVTSLGQWLGLMAGKQVGNATARTEIRATGAGSGTFDETTDSEEAIRDRGDAAWTEVSGQEVRDAMKLAPTAGAPAAGSVDLHLDTIEADAQLARRLLKNRMEISGAGILTLYADDGSTPLLTTQLYKDAGGTLVYSPTPFPDASHRRNALT